MAKDTREQMIRTAVRLFQRDGYNATSWRGLVKEAGTPWGSINHHFPGGKDELGVAAIEAGSQEVLASMDWSFEHESRPADAVARWFELGARRLKDSDYEGGCPIATVALETATGSPPLRDATRSAFRAWERRLSTHLQSSGIARSSARELAVSVLALLEGALLLARTRGDLAPMRAAAGQAKTIVDAAATAA